MALKDIEKLKEKVTKDPNSKLFVPLAEEYRKEGMMDDAINVLREGLERQPGYMSARVALGKIYLEQGMHAEAREEFENVVKSIPDNLYAQKKLAEIYRDAGEKDLAIKSYRTVLKLNSMDEDAVYNLNDLENNGGEGADSAAQDSGEAVKVDAEPGAGGAIFDDFVVSDSTHDNVEAEAAEESVLEAVPADEEINAFRDSIFAEKEEKTGQEGEAQQAGLQGIWDKQFEEVESHLSAEPAHENNEATDLPEAMQDAVLGNIEESQTEDDMASSSEEIRPAPGAETGEENSEADSPGAPLLDIEKFTAEADAFISQGNYAGALGIYRNILSSNPGDKRILQRADELRALLKLIGKDKETLVAQLNSFLEGIMKRRNGLPGNS